MSAFEIPLELAEQFGRGNGVLFAGAGLSMGAGLPDWAGLISGLRDELPGCPPDSDHRDVASYYELEFGRNRLVQRIRDQLDTLNLRPTRVHHALAELPVPLIVTTNFDDLIEQTYRADQKPYSTVTRAIDAGFWSNDRTQIVKIHGDLAIPESIVITSGDYEGVTTDRPALVRLLGATLQTRTVLFVGYSVNDPDLRTLLTQLRQETGDHRRNLYSIQFDAPPLAVKDLERRGVRVINISLAGRSPSDVLLTWLTELRERALRHGAPQVEIPRDRGNSKPDTQLADEVAGLLRTMGYDVSQPRRSPGVVDFRASKHSEGSHILRWIRCVEGSVGSGHIDGALALRPDDDPEGEVWVVAYRSGVFTSQAKTRAKSVPGTRIMSIAQFYRTMLNIDSYLSRLIDEYDTERIDDLWVGLACEVPQYDRMRTAPTSIDSFDDVESFLDVWIDTPGRNHISIVGDFGTGKSWLCRHYAARLARRYLDDCEHNRVPILISLRDRSRGETVNLKELITDTLVNDYGLHLPGGYETFQFLNRHDSLVLILDGFDEMQARVDDLATVRNFDELAKVVEPEANCKAILTCRTSYFRTDLEEREVLAGEGLQRIHLRDRPNFEILHLVQFDDRRIRDALERLVGNRAESYYQQMQQIYDLVDLAQRPILLAMIASTLPKLVGLATVNPAALYEIYTDEWMRKNLTEQRSILESRDHRHLMQELAWEMFRRETASVHYSELPRALVDSLPHSRTPLLHSYEHDVRTQSFLQRDNAGYYSFAHKSFMEFFIAQRIFTDIFAGDNSRLAEAQTSHETDQFIKDLLLREPVHIATLNQWMNSGHTPVLQVNAAGIISKLGDPSLTSGVIQLLNRDKKVRHLYLTAVIFRVLEVRWEAAQRLASEPNGRRFPQLLTLTSDQLKTVASRFCREARNPRDGVARWLSLALLQQVSDVATTDILSALDEVEQHEDVPEVRELIPQMRQAMIQGTT
ncbi:SIR2 family protein [Streptomyces brevispora]|uniref:SIR2 family protein n=1 Tax=Streptomyces brevispora TaxID=887462 RepID=A0ABZ1G3N3_9ACTN|nr:SIR2 family protein [Streptomyces brevispora]WSC13835.1 SIR2 family protein [Streptomyces brevispora]